MLAPLASAQSPTPASPIAYQGLALDFAGSETLGETGTISLPANSAVPIVFEHFQEGGTAVAELRWTVPGGTKVIIPASNLRPSLDENNAGIPDSCPASACAFDFNAGAHALQDNP